MAVRLRLTELLGSPYCTAAEDGDAVREVLATHLRAGKGELLSFEGVEDLTSAFLNSAVGHLVEEFGADVVRARVQAVDATPYQAGLLRKVVDRAERFYQDPERMRRLERAALFGERDDEAA